MVPKSRISAKWSVKRHKNLRHCAVGSIHRKSMDIYFAVYFLFRTYDVFRFEIKWTHFIRLCCVTIKDRGWVKGNNGADDKISKWEWDAYESHCLTVQLLPKVADSSDKSHASAFILGALWREPKCMTRPVTLVVPEWAATTKCLAGGGKHRVKLS